MVKLVSSIQRQEQKPFPTSHWPVLDKLHVTLALPSSPQALLASAPFPETNELGLFGVSE
jgi:hypothetical protein